MAKGFSLAPYTIRIRNRRTHSNVSLKDFEIDGNDIFNLLENYFDKRLSESSKDDIQQNLLRVKQSEADEDLRLISGIIETGSFGYRSTFYNVENEEESFHRDIYDAEMLPFYFLFSHQKDFDEGLIILQRFHIYGIKTVLEQDIREYFDSLSTDYSISLYPLIYESVLDEYAKSDLKEIKLVKFTLPRNIEEAYKRERTAPEESYVELVIKAKKSFSLEFARDIIQGYLKSLRGKTVTSPVNRLIEVDGFDYDTIKVEFNVGGKRRKMDLSNPYSISAYYDITDEVETENGIPIFRSIDAIAQDYLETMEKSLSSDNL